MEELAVEYKKGINANIVRTKRERQGPANTKRCPKGAIHIYTYINNDYKQHLDASHDTRLFTSAAKAGTSKENKERGDADGGTAEGAAGRDCRSPEAGREGATRGDGDAGGGGKPGPLCVRCPLRVSGVTDPVEQQWYSLFSVT